MPLDFPASPSPNDTYSFGGKTWIMNSSLQGDHVVTVALLGRAPCRVTGTIQRGDLLVSSDKPGVAMALIAGQYQPGSVIGKALADSNSAEESVIEVLVGRL